MDPFSLRPTISFLILLPTIPCHWSLNYESFVCPGSCRHANPHCVHLHPEGCPYSAIAFCHLLLRGAMEDTLCAGRCGCALHPCCGYCQVIKQLSDVRCRVAFCRVKLVSHHFWTRCHKHCHPEAARKRFFEPAFPG